MSNSPKFLNLKMQLHNCFKLKLHHISLKKKNLWLYQVRPPGHHAGVRHAMGFCLHNNAAVAALVAQAAGAKKVLIVDWVMLLITLNWVIL